MSETVRTLHRTDPMSALVGVLLVCFPGKKSAAHARGAIESAIQSSGDVVLDTVVARVDEKHKATVYDPRRVRAGVLTAFVTWGIFGLLTGGDVQGVISSGLFGAILGGIGGYVMEHVLAKSELARIGAQLPPSTSALIVFTKSAHPERQLDVTANQQAAATSVAAIASDLTARVYPEPDDPRATEDSGEHLKPADGLLNMILMRYPDTEKATDVAARFGDRSTSLKESVQIELVSSTSAGGKRRVSDPTHGSAAVAKSNIVSWGVLGLIIGAVAGATGGGGILGFLGGSVATGVGYAICGVLAGVLYGRYAGRAISGNELKSIGPLVPPGTSMILAWAEGASTDEAVSALREPTSESLVLTFMPVSNGAVLRTGQEDTAVA